jgi:GDP-L-fucose synthase
MKIVVLGGHGFVGKNYCELMNESDDIVIPLSTRDGLDLQNLLITKEIISLHKPDIIVNFAANVGSLNYVTKYAATVFDSNMRMLLNTYKAASGVVPNALIINPIANCAYPGHEELYIESKFLNGPPHQSVFAYGNTRRAMDVLSKVYAMQFGFRSINFFVPNMYGPYDSTDPNKAHALNALISRVVKLKREKKDTLEVWGSGIAIREWLYAKDCARIFDNVIKNKDKKGWDIPMNIGQNFGLSVRELIQIICEETGFEGKISWDRSKPDGAPQKIMDDQLFKKNFPDFKFTELRNGIRETIKYYQSIYPY